MKEKMDEAELRLSQSRRGMSLEQKVEEANRVYQLRGLGVIVKQPTPWTVFRRGKDYKAVPAKKSTVDFLGFYHSLRTGLVPTSIECKRFTGTSFPMAEDHLRDCQLRFMAEFEGCGGAAYLLFDVERLNSAFLVPAYEVAQKVFEMKQGGRKSLPLNWFQGREPVFEVEGVFDYLSLLREVA